MGPNGSGKTTLLRALARQNTDYAGRIRLFGEDLRTLCPARLASLVSHLPQFPEAGLHLTVAMAVMLGRAPCQNLLGWATARDHEAVDKAMSLTGVTHLKDRTLASLSGGELKRALLAQALCREPRVLLLDEPTASLDPGHTQRIMNMLEAARSERSLTLVVVVHDLNLAATCADRMLLLKDGHLVARGTPASVLTADNLARTYDWEMHVDTNPLTGTPRVTPFPGAWLLRRGVYE